MSQNMGKVQYACCMLHAAVRGRDEANGENRRERIDPATGAFESVELTPVLIQPNSVYSICNTGHACWHGWLSPHIWYGFDGSGATGTWPNRGSFYTSGYYARPCWLYSGSTVCAEAYSPKYSTITWGQELTGKRVYLTT